MLQHIQVFCVIVFFFFLREKIFYFIVEIKNEEIEEIFLDKILIDIQQIDQNKCLLIGKN